MVLLCDKLAVGIPRPGHNTLLQRQCSRRPCGLSASCFAKQYAPRSLHRIAGVSCGPAVLRAGRAQERVPVPGCCCPHLLPHAACDRHRLHASAPITDGLLRLAYLQVCERSRQQHAYVRTARRRASASAERCACGQRLAAACTDEPLRLPHSATCLDRHLPLQAPACWWWSCGRCRLGLTS